MNSLYQLNSNVVAINKRGVYTLAVVHDEYAENPRGDYEYKETEMVCWHKRYALGDSHSHDDPREFLEWLIAEAYHGNEQKLIDYAMDGDQQSFVKLSLEGASYVLYVENNSSEWESVAEDQCPANELRYSEWLLEELVKALPNSELIKLIEDSGKYVMKPLYLYDHSGLTISTTPFSCQWDSGQIGWVYVEVEKIRGDIDDVIEGEVKIYDTFLRGEFYCYTLYDGDNEIESCGGISGGWDEIISFIMDCVPDEFRNMAYDLEFV